jgi:hypothetical protein
MSVARSWDVPRWWRFHSFDAFRADGRQRTARRVHGAIGVTRMPSRPAVWIDLIRSTCAVLAPYAMRCALGLQLAFATGAVTVR